MPERTYTEAEVAEIRTAASEYTERKLQEQHERHQQVVERLLQVMGDATEELRGLRIKVEAA